MLCEGPRSKTQPHLNNNDVIEYQFLEQNKVRRKPIVNKPHVKEDQRKQTKTEKERRTDLRGSVYFEM